MDGEPWEGGWGNRGRTKGLEVDGDDRECAGEIYERNGGG